MESLRKLKKLEEDIIDYIITKYSVYQSPNWKLEIMVQPLSDGGMGSLYLIPNSKRYKTQEQRQPIHMVGDLEFNDEDGVLVLASLYIDNEGYLYELDIWKVDFSPLISFPFQF